MLDARLKIILLNQYYLVKKKILERRGEAGCRIFESYSSKLQHKIGVAKLLQGLTRSDIQNTVELPGGILSVTKCEGERKLLEKSSTAKTSTAIP